jgi:2-octaprenyl-6-methoxyphenol hydroxylase
MNDEIHANSRTAPHAAPHHHLAVIGAGPVGLALALHAAQVLPDAQITLFDARLAEHDVSTDARTLALSLGSVRMLERLGAWEPGAAQPILEVHVSQQPPSMPWLLDSLLGPSMAEPCLRICAEDEGVPLLGAVLSYGQVVSTLQRRWQTVQSAQPERLHSQFGHKVLDIKNLASSVEVNTEIAEHFDLAVVAEGGVFASQMRKAVTHDYQQTAWVGTVEFEAQKASISKASANLSPFSSGVAFERFTRHGPVALLPFKDGRAGLVWCVPSQDDPVRDLTDAQRLAVLRSVFHADVARNWGQMTEISPLKHFPLGLNAERTLTSGRTVRIGNAAQTLHPVAGQGLNLGLRDAFALVQALSRSPDVGAVLRKLEWQRGPDRWAMIAATDFLARSFTWKLPGAGAARGLGIAALQQLKPLKSALARQMMFG